MTTLEAVLKVLQEAGRPLHYLEITKRVLAAKLWKTDGKTPEATINARLAVDVKKNAKASAFRRAGRGVFGLNTERTDPMPHQPGLLRTEDPALYVTGPRAGETLSFTDAAERILEASRGKPMHYRDITRHALEHKMLDTSGNRPASFRAARNFAAASREDAGWRRE